MSTEQNKPQKKRRLGDELVYRGLVTADQIDIALTEQKKSGEALGKALISLGFITERVLRDLLGDVQGKDIIDLTISLPSDEAIALISNEFARQYHIIPISFIDNNLSIAMTDIYNLKVIDRIHSLLGSQIKISPKLAGESEIQDAFDRFYGYDLSIDGILREIETGETTAQSMDANNEQYSQPVVRLVDVLLGDAIKRGASDIHFEPEEKFLRLRYRIDGILMQVRSLHIDYWSAILVRIKVISGMNIAETRMPQDGRISRDIQGHTIDFRVSAQPITHGENLVLRILDRTKGIIPIDNLGIHDESLMLMKLMMSRPEGIILVTGPTGSGKTTTLYSMLNHINSEKINIMTLEDPVEYPMDLIRQTSINEVSRMDFASGIRSLMRQDPDVILVGEIRDEDTAEMAFRAAMTGHQVYSTLHTNSAIGSIPRLLDIGVIPDIMAGNIIGIIGQRLIRKLCQKCKSPRLVNDIEAMLLGVDESHQIYEAKGCSHCANSGYKGRVGVLEVLKINDELDELIADRAHLTQLKKAAKKSGYKTLADDGVKRILDGVTTLEEVGRVIDLTERLD
jgi:type II secretory ATPase GspE/PulE/Tfp pilus assembly ATPase PilB-like protein